GADPQRVVQSEHSNQTSRLGHENSDATATLEPAEELLGAGNADALAEQQISAAHNELVTVRAEAHDAQPRGDVMTASSVGSDASGMCGAQNGGGHGMLDDALGAGGEGEDVVFAEVPEGVNLGHLWLPGEDRATRTQDALGDS